MATIEMIEPFAYGYLNCVRDDAEYKIASGMLKMAEHMKIYLDAEATFASFFRWEDEIAYRYSYGNGIQLRDFKLNARKEKYPELAFEIEELDRKLRPLVTDDMFEAALPDSVCRVKETGGTWKGPWGGHANPDFRMLLRLGTNGLREKNEIYRKINSEKSDFYDSLNLVLDAIELLGKRTRALALSLAERTTGDAKRRMMRVAEAFENIPENPPRSLFEAFQFFWLGATFDGIDSPGRFDYTMDEYYGKATREEQTELLCALWQEFKNVRIWNLCIGGSDEKGNYFHNQLTYDILEVARRYKYNTPNLTMRIAPNMPEELWESAAKTISSGIGMPVLYNDEVVCPALEELGIPDYDSHNYCMNGCNQIDIFGKSHMGLEDGELCLAKCLELTLFNGFSPKQNIQVGIETGDPCEFESYEDFYSAYKKQTEYIIEQGIEFAEIKQKIYAEYAPNPYRSMLIAGCVEKGLDYKNRGPVYGHGQILAEGIADTADSLAALKHFVYDTKKYTMKQLTEALKANFHGFDELYHDFSTYKKFGNDIDEVDNIASEIVDHFNRYLMTKRTFRGGVYTGGCSPFNRVAHYGALIGALPNGKKADSALLADSIGAVPGADMNGPTALLNSAMKYDQYKAKSGFILNLKFNKTVFGTERGMKAFISLAKTYFAGGGQQLSVAVLSADDLRDAQKNPDKYKNLIVRVGGYSDYFCNLSPELQENIIARSELNV